jgi:hypothetical protein
MGLLIWMVVAGFFCIEGISINLQCQTKSAFSKSFFAMIDQTYV